MKKAGTFSNRLRLAREDVPEVSPVRVGVAPVLDPVRAAGGHVVEPCHVSDRVHVFDGRAEVVVDDDPVVELEAAAVEEVDVGLDAHTDDGEECLDRAARCGADTRQLRARSR